MRKFTRIFAALLSICLVVGAVIIFALAKAPATIEDFGRSYDFEANTPGSDYTKNFGSGSGDAGTYSSLKVIHDEATDNNYIRYAFKKAAASRYRRDFQYAPYSASEPSVLLSDYSFFTLDFDVCADQYIYELNGVTEMGNIIPEGAENVRLSYNEGTNFSFDNRIFDEASNKYFGGGYTSLQVTFKYDSKAGAWRVHLGNNSEATPYYLTNTLGQWNHFTYAVKVIEKNGVYGYSQVRLYFNGELVGTSNISTSNAASSYRINPRAIDWYVGSGALTTPYSMGVDNFKPSFYPLGYTSGSAYGIDDLYEDTDTSKSISWCEDVVYSLDYAAPGSPYISIDTGSTKYYSPLAKDFVLQKIKNGTIIETGMDILDFTPPENVDNFEVYILGNAKFSLSKEAQQLFVQEVSALGYRVSKLSNDDAIVINWLDSKGGNVVKSEYLSADTVPSYVSDTVGVLDFVKGELIKATVTDWYFDIDGEGNAAADLNKDEEPIRALTVNEINEVKQYCNGVLNIYPDPENGSVPGGVEKLAYAIEYIDNNGNSYGVADVNGGFDSYKDISTLAVNVNNAPSGSIIHLYSFDDNNTNIQVNENIVVGKNDKLSIDMNGMSIAFAENCGFVLSDGSELNVYSSAIGSVLSFADNSIAFTTGGDFNSCNVNLGKYGDFDGDNLSVIAENLFDIRTASARSNDNKNVNINIEVNEISGSFIFAASDIYVNIANSIVNGNVLFNTDNSVDMFTAVEANVVISNSVITADALVGEWSANAKLLISASDVYAFASDNDDVKGKVEFGADNKFVYDVRDEGEFISTVENVEFAYSDILYSFNDSDVTISLITFDITAENDEITEVVFNDAKGNFFASGYYHNSVSDAICPSAEEMTDTTRFPLVDDLDNDWYDIGYTDWINSTDNVGGKAIVHGVKNVFIPVSYGPVASLDFMVNASLRTTEVGLNLLVKIPEADCNVIFDPNTSLYYYDDNGDLVQTSYMVDFVGVDGYYAFELPLDVDSFIPRDAYIVFSVGGFDGNGDGVEEDEEYDSIVLRKAFSIDFMVYAETVSKVCACGSDDSKVVFDLVQYKYNAYLASAGERTDDELVERIGKFLTSHGENCVCRTDLSDIDFSDAEKDASIEGNEQLSDVILGTEVDFSQEKPRLYFYVDSYLDVQSFNVKHKGLEYNKGGWDYINNKIETQLVNVGTKEVDGVTCNVYEYEDILLCNFASVMNISLTLNLVDENGATITETLSGAWSLASYIEECDDSNLIKSLYAASVSALEYRLIRDGE